MREKYKKIITLSSIVVLTCGIINNAIIYSFVEINKKNCLAVWVNLGANELK